MAYAQWVSVTIQPKGFALHISNAQLQWGKFYSGSKDNEITVQAVDQITIPDGQTGTVSACGREDASSGTQGSFDLYDGGTLVGTYQWDCPWGSKTNVSTWVSSNPNYIAQATGGNLDGGALGNVTIKVAKF